MLPSSYGFTYANKDKKNWRNFEGTDTVAETTANEIKCREIWIIEKVHVEVDYLQ